MKNLTITGFSLAIPALLLTNACRKLPDERPSIILIVADDHGLDALGCYGNPVIKTPNLDNLASRGVRFTNSFCTSASSSASRSVILTGLYNHATAHYGHAHDYHHFSTYDTVRSLPVILADKGYVTGRIGKYHLAPDKVYSFQHILNANPRNTVEMAENCREFIRSSGKKPFFLYFCTDDPHRDSPFKSEPWDKPNSFGNKAEGYPGVDAVKYSPEEVLVPRFLPDTPESRAELAEYYQSVSRIDQGIGRLIKILEESGKADNTVIIYISDNGIAFPGAKTTLYDPGMRVPCIITAPEMKRKGGVCNAMITWTDLTPTILDFAGAYDSPGRFHGRSFRSVLDTENPAGWDEIYASHTFHEVTMYYPMRVVMNREYKLIWNIAWRLDYPFASDLWDSPTYQGVIKRGLKQYGKRSLENYIFRPEFELYNIVADPDEINNLASDKKYESVLNDLKQKIKDFQLRTRDPWIIKWSNENVFGGTGVNL